MARGRTTAVGRRAEQLAKRFLGGQGLRPIAENYRCRLGEIDLVMAEGSQIVFVEVRYRSSRRLSNAKHTVDRHKRQKLIRTAAMFLASSPRFANCVVRFDVVGIDQEADGSRKVHWVRDAFRPTDAAL